MHHSALSALFQCENTTLAQGETEFVSRVRLHSFPSPLTCHCRTSRSLVFLQSYPHQIVLLLKPLLLLPRSVAVEITLALPLAGVGCLAEWLTPPKTHKTMAKRMQEQEGKADDEPGLACCDKFSDCAKSNCIKVRGYSGHLVKNIGRVEGDL